MFIIRTTIEDATAFEQLMMEYPTLISKAETRNFDAETLLVALIVSSLPQIILQVSEICKALIGKNRVVEIEYNGIKFKGENPNEMIEVITQLNQIELNQSPLSDKNQLFNADNNLSQ